MAKIGKGTVLIVGLLVLVSYFAVQELALFNEYTVTVTERSPAIEINNVQYKYEYFPFKYEGEILSGLSKGGSSGCDLRPGELTPQQLIGRWSGHKLVVNYDFIRRFWVERGFTEDCPSVGGAQGLSTSWDSVYQTGINLKDSYYDGQFIEGLSAEKMTPYTGLVFGQDCRDLGDYYIGTTEDYIWVNVNDIMVKFIINYENPLRSWSIDDTGCYKSGGGLDLDDACRPSGDKGSYCRAKFVITAVIYVPASEFEPSYCGDNNCDLDESCETCEQDCGQCIVPKCGNGVCDDDEAYFVCPADCEPVDPFCGDGFCNNNETCLTCTQDCGQCSNAHCGDGECNADETCVTCEGDCGACPSVCGNGACESDETSTNCPLDCSPGDVADFEEKSLSEEEIEEEERKKKEGLDVNLILPILLIIAIIVLVFYILKRKR